MKLSPETAKDVVPMLFQSHVDLSQRMLLRPSAIVRKPPPELVSGTKEKMAMTAVKTAVMVREMLRPEPEADARGLLMSFVLGGYFFEKEGQVTQLATDVISKRFLTEDYREIPLSVLDGIYTSLQQIVDQVSRDPNVAIATKEGVPQAEMYMHIVMDAGWHTGKGIYRYEHDGEVLEAILAASEEKDA